MDTSLKRSAPQKTIGYFLYPDAQATDIMGSLDCFAAVNDQCMTDPLPPPYQLILISQNSEPVSASNGCLLSPHATFANCPPLDYLILPGGRGSRTISEDQEVIAWVQQHFSASTRVISICTGAYILAATGLADQHRIATHWSWANHLQQRFPNIQVDADSLFILGETICSSGGLTSGIDLTLALIEEDFGSSVAMDVAREMVVYMRRPGNQSQFSKPLAAQKHSVQHHGSERLKPAIDWMINNLHQPISIETIAEKAHLSVRHLRREFNTVFSSSPSDYLETIRLEHAKYLLSTSNYGLQNIADLCGFNSADVLSRRFKNAFHILPSEYRLRFHTKS